MRGGRLLIARSLASRWSLKPTAFFLFVFQLLYWCPLQAWKCLLFDDHLPQGRNRPLSSKQHAHISKPFSHLQKLDHGGICNWYWLLAMNSCIHAPGLLGRCVFECPLDDFRFRPGPGPWVFSADLQCPTAVQGCGRLFLRLFCKNYICINPRRTKVLTRFRYCQKKRHLDIWFLRWKMNPQWRVSWMNSAPPVYQQCKTNISLGVAWRRASDDTSFRCQVVITQLQQ